MNGLNRNSKFFSAKELVDMYLSLDVPPKNIDISGGSPDLVPEFIYWFLKELENRGLMGKVSIWVDSNLEYEHFRTLSPDVVSYIAEFPNIMFLCSLKGWDEESASLNARSKNVFKNQIKGIEFLIKSKIPFYFYLTFVSVNSKITPDIKELFRILYCIDRSVPLRAIVLKVSSFSAMSSKSIEIIRK